MKKKLIVSLLKKAGYQESHGAKHDIFKKDGDPPITVPRHTEISERTAKTILKQAGIEM
jgi:predicted RNA binding protein YcfA (HicA-like mRNA interferase family)